MLLHIDVIFFNLFIFVGGVGGGGESCSKNWRMYYCILNSLQIIHLKYEWFIHEIPPPTHSYGAIVAIMVDP